MIPFVTVLLSTWLDDEPVGWGLVGGLRPHISWPQSLFGTRWKNDFYGNRDFGDVVVLIDGRKELVSACTSSWTPTRLVG